MVWFVDWCGVLVVGGIRYMLDGVCVIFCFFCCFCGDVVCGCCCCDGCWLCGDVIGL